MAKRLLALPGMLALLLTAAVPAMAESEPMLVGTLESSQCPVVEDSSCPDYGMTDEVSGTYYGILSEEDLGIYEGQRVDVFFDGTVAQSDPPLVMPTRVEPAEGPAPGSSATFTYELAVECEPPADAEFLGLLATESLVTTPLTDPDGDGVYAGSQKIPRFAPGGSQEEPIEVSTVRIVQRPPTGTGSLDPEYRVIEDFGAVTAEDTTLSASVSFCDGGPGNGNGTPVVSGGTNNAGGGNGGDSESGARVLPKTGGVALVLVGALLLTGAGLLMRRVVR